MTDAGGHMEITRSDVRVLWTDERDDQLKALLTDKTLGYTQIGHRLGVTKNAISGRVNRLGLSGTKPPAKSGHPPLPLEERLRRHREREARRLSDPEARRRHYDAANLCRRAKRLVMAAVPKFVCEDIYIAPEPPPEFRALGLLDLRPFSKQRDNDCRFARGEHAPYVFCGAPTATGKSYCPYHERLCASDYQRRR